MDGLYLAPPHGRLIAEGKKTIVASASGVDRSGQRVLVSGRHALGEIVLGAPYGVSGTDFEHFFPEHRVKENERARWWPDADRFYFSEVLAFSPYSEPLQVDVSPGTTMDMGKVAFSAKSYSRSKCMRCKAAPEIDVQWADGRGRAWFCRKCFSEWVKEVKDPEIVRAWAVSQGTVPEKIKGYSYKPMAAMANGANGYLDPLNILKKLDMIAAMEKAFSGVIFGLFLPKKEAQALVLRSPSGDARPVPPQDMHITLVYLGDKEELKDKQALLKMIAGGVAAQRGPIRGKIGGLGRFSKAENDRTNAFYASYDSQDLSPFREALMAVLSVAGITPGSEHGFTPHITLAYIPVDESVAGIPMPPEIPVTFNNLTLAWGDERIEFPFCADEAEKGGPGSGNWAHTSLQRVGVGKGGSDPAGTGGAVASMGLPLDSTIDERREASQRMRADRSAAPRKDLTVNSLRKRLAGAKEFEAGKIPPMIDWSAEHYQQWRQQLREDDPDSFYALRGYTALDYKRVNTLLRGGVQRLYEKYAEANPAPHMRQVERMERGIDKAPTIPEDVVTYRIIKPKIAQQFSAGGVGSIVTDKGFASVSLNESIEAVAPGSTQVLRILLPKGTKGAALFDSIDTPGYIAGIFDEAEILLGRGMQFMVLETGPQVTLAAIGQATKEFDSKGGPGSGNWGHTSFQREADSLRGGSDPAGVAGGGLAFLDLDSSSSVAERKRWSKWARENRGERVIERLGKAQNFSKYQIDTKALEWVDKGFQQWRDEISDPEDMEAYTERRMLSWYTGSGYRSINGTLRHGEDAARQRDPGDYNAEQVQKGIRYMDRALARESATIPEDVKTTRLISSDELVKLKDMPVGGTFIDKGYPSTSLNPEMMPVRYTRTERVTILLPKGTKGAALGGSDGKEINFTTMEAEILLPRNTRFMVLRNTGGEVVLGVVGQASKELSEKGGPGSGNWAHTSLQRVGVGRGGSDPAGTGGAVASMGLPLDSTIDERREASRQAREDRAAGKGKEKHTLESLRDRYAKAKEFEAGMHIPMAQWNTEHYKQWQTDLANNDDDAFSSIQWYTSDGYESTNIYLRKGFEEYRSRFPNKVRSFTDKTIDGLDRGIDSAPRVPEDIITYRMVKPKIADQMISGGVGSIVTDKGFASVSLDEAISAPTEGASSILRILLPKGTKGASVGDTMFPEKVMSAIPSEMEILLGRGMRFMVLETGPQVTLAAIGQEEG